MNFHFELIQLTYSVIFFFIILAVLGHILSVNKTPASTLSWVLIILIWPYFGLPLYIVFGTRKFTKKTPLLSPAPYEALIAVTDSVQRVLMASGSSAPCTNSQIKFLNGEETYHSLVELINNAKKSIYLETFIFKNDDVGKQILECLIKKQKDGVEVKILLDSLGAHMPGHPHFGAFIKAGGKVEMFMPIIHRPFRGMANLRNHRKLIVIDHRTVILGGMNIAEEYMGPEKNADRWVDLAMKIEGPMVYQIENVFHSDWAYATHSLPLKSQASLSPIEENKHLAQLALSGPDIEADPIYEFLLTAIYGAKKRVWIATPYFVPDEALAKALELAARRGVDVTLAIPFKSNHMLADLSRRTYLEQIINAGANVMTYPKMIHAKLTVVDENYAFTGSANVDCRSLLLNYESGICLYSPEDITQMSDWMQDILSKCSPYSRRKTYLDTWISGLARLFSPIL